MKLSRERESNAKMGFGGGAGVKQGTTCCCSGYMCHLKKGVNVPSRIPMTCAWASHKKTRVDQLRKICLCGLYCLSEAYILMSLKYNELYSKWKLYFTLVVVPSRYQHSNALPCP